MIGVNLHGLAERRSLFIVWPKEGKWAQQRTPSFETTHKHDTLIFWEHPTWRWSVLTVELHTFLQPAEPAFWLILLFICVNKSIQCDTGQAWSPKLRTRGKNTSADHAVTKACFSSDVDSLISRWPCVSNIFTSAYSRHLATTATSYPPQPSKLQISENLLGEPDVRCLPETI